MKRIAAWIAACSAAAAFAAASAVAITNGIVDGTAHPSVGALIADVPGTGRVPVCSGGLVSSTVFVTAAHCTAQLEQLGITRVWVTLDPAIDVQQHLRAGTVHTDPAFDPTAQDVHDVAVVTLDTPVNGVEPLALPAAGQLDRIDGKKT